VERIGTGHRHETKDAEQFSKTAIKTKETLLLTWKKLKKSLSKETGRKRFKGTRRGEGDGSIAERISPQRPTENGTKSNPTTPRERGRKHDQKEKGGVQTSTRISRSSEKKPNPADKVRKSLRYGAQTLALDIPKKTTAKKKLTLRRPIKVGGRTVTESSTISPQGGENVLWKAPL